MKFATEEIRTRAVKAVLSKIATIAQVAQIMGYTVASIKNWIAVYQTEGRLSAKPNGHRQSCFSAEERETLKAVVAEQPDITLQEIKDRFQKDCSLSAIHRILVKLGLRFKKNFKSFRTGPGRREGSS